MGSSAAVGGDHVLHILALHADELHILAAVDAAGQAAQDAREIEQAAPPGDGHTPHFPPSDVLSVGSAVFAGSTVVVVVVVDHDDGGLLGGAVAGLLHSVTGLLAVHGRRLSVSRLSVHELFQIK